MKNLRLGQIMSIILAVAVVLVIVGAIVYKNKTPGTFVVTDIDKQQLDEQQLNTQTSPVSQSDLDTISESDLSSDEKNRSAIQDLLRIQCKALSDKDIKTLMGTMDQSNASSFQKYQTSVEALMSMTVSVESCKYDILSIVFIQTPAGLTAEADEKGDLRIKLIDNYIRVVADPNLIIKEKYIFTNNKWKTVILSSQ